MIQVMTTVAKQALALCSSQEQWGVPINYKEIMTQFKNLALQKGATEEEYTAWVKEAKRLWGTEWLKEVYRSKVNVEIVEASLRAAFLSKRLDGGVEQLVELFKNLQLNGKIDKVETAGKFVYTYQLTLVALNTLYNLGLVSKKDAREYVASYIKQHPSLNSYFDSYRNSVLKLFEPSFIEFRDSDGCHDSTGSLGRLLIWKPMER